jgi:hypothetical protein
MTILYRKRSNEEFTVYRPLVMTTDCDDLCSDERRWLRFDVDHAPVSFRVSDLGSFAVVGGTKQIGHIPIHSYGYLKSYVRIVSFLVYRTTHNAQLLIKW